MLVVELQFLLHFLVVRLPLHVNTIAQFLSHVVIHLLIAAILGSAHRAQFLLQRSVLVGTSSSGTFLVGPRILDAISFVARQGNVACMHALELAIHYPVILLLDQLLVQQLLVGRHVGLQGVIAGIRVPPFVIRSLHVLM